MAFYRRSGGSNVAPSVVRRRSGSGWADVQTIKRRSGSSWVTVWTAYTPISASMGGTGTYNNPTAGTGYYTTSLLVVSASQGTGSYTYTWSVTSGSGWSINGQGTQSASFQNYCQSGRTASGTVQCVVSDGKSSVTLTHNISIAVGTPL